MTPTIEISVEFDEDNEPHFIFSMEALSVFIRELADVVLVNGIGDNTPTSFAENVVDGIYENSLAKGEYELSNDHTKH